MDSSAKLSRREALIGAGATGLAVMVGVKVNRGTGQAFFSVGGDEAFAAGACTMQTPQKEIGPFFVDENLNRSDIRASSDGSNVQTGVPLALTIDIFDDDDSCNPIVGAKVNVWQANAIGVYSDEAAESTTGQTWLRGYQLTGSDGKVSFTTIWPGWYSGRTCHIHFMVALPAVGSLPAATFICQLFFPEAETELVAATAPYTSNPNARTLNTADRVYSSDGASVTVTLSGDVSGYVASFSAGASRTAADTSGSGGGGGGGTPPPMTGTTTTTTQTTSGTTTSTTTTGTATANNDGIVHAALSSVAIVRRSNGDRHVHLVLKPKELIGVVASLTRSGKTIATKQGSLAAGTRAINLPIPKATASGAARLKLRLTDADNNVKTYSRAVHLPARKKSG